jgi:hypothetical protein
MNKRWIGRTEEVSKQDLKDNKGRWEGLPLVTGEKAKPKDAARMWADAHITEEGDHIVYIRPGTFQDLLDHFDTYAGSPDFPPKTYAFAVSVRAHHETTYEAFKVKELEI